mmetsp:Transcript_24105/g.60727  ORF Transcript_24105/g.60727 Transcript_24105/m.60727 type:complete len:244 (-) Transcript_24105:751-1482(-)
MEEDEEVAADSDEEVGKAVPPRPISAALSATPDAAVSLTRCPCRLLVISTASPISSPPVTSRARFVTGEDPASPAATPFPVFSASSKLTMDNRYFKRRICGHAASSSDSPRTCTTASHVPGYWSGNKFPSGSNVNVRSSAQKGPRAHRRLWPLWTRCDTSSKRAVTSTSSRSEGPSSVGRWIRPYGRVCVAETSKVSRTCRPCAKSAGRWFSSPGASVRRPRNATPFVSLSPHVVDSPPLSIV